MGADIGYEGATAALPWSSLPWTGSTLPVALAGSASATRRPASASTLWRAPCARSSFAPARAATSPASAFSVAAIRVVSAGRDVGHVVAVQVLRTAIHVIICGLLIGFRLCGRLATGFRRRLGDPKSGCQIGNAGDPVLPQEIERRWIDASLLCQLIDDRRLELDLCQQEGVWLPSQAVEGHQPRRMEFPARIGHPSRLVQASNKGRRELGLVAAVVSLFVGALEDPPATPFLEVAQALP